MQSGSRSYAAVRSHSIRVSFARLCSCEEDVCTRFASLEGGHHGQRHAPGGPAMTVAELIQELEQEAGNTRRTLERVPEDRLAWKPHEKSPSLGQLALHIATLPGAIA